MNQTLKILLKVVIEFFAFLLIVVLLNIAAGYLKSLPVGENAGIIDDGIDFLNGNILWVGLIVLLIFLGEATDLMKFPFNLPSPLFYSIGIILMINLIYNIFMFIIDHTPTKINIPFGWIFIIVSILVVLVVLITGYYSIFSTIPKKKTEGEEDYRYKEKDEETKRKEEQEKKRLEEEHFREADEDKKEDEDKEEDEDDNEKEDEEEPKEERRKANKKREQPKIKKKVKRTRFVR